MELHSPPTAPVLVHSVAPGEGHAMEAHAPAGQVTSHAHELLQEMAPHAPAAAHWTLHAAVEQVRSWHAPVTAQAMLHGTLLPHRRSPHAFALEQAMVHVREPEPHSVPLHALTPVHSIEHAYPVGQIVLLHLLG